MMSGGECASFLVGWTMVCNVSVYGQHQQLEWILLSFPWKDNGKTSARLFPRIPKESLALQVSISMCKAHIKAKATVKIATSNKCIATTVVTRALLLVTRSY